MCAWYDLPPREYARGLIYNAERCDRQAARLREEGKPWSEYEAERCQRDARRLRAMAILCEKSSAERAGQVDFLGMSNPAQTREEEAAAVAYAELLT